jgi:hypothetical protein
LETPAIHPDSPTTAPPAPRDPSRDINAGAVLFILLAGALAIADTVLFVVAYHNNSSRADFESQSVDVPYRDLQQYRLEQAQKLGYYGPSQAKGAFTIEEAMRRYVIDYAKTGRSSLVVIPAPATTAPSGPASSPVEAKP